MHLEKRAEQREAGQLTSEYSEFFGAGLGLFGGASILHSVNPTEMELSMTTDLCETRNRPAMQTGRVVRGGAAYKSEQGSDYEPGVSAETAGSQAVFLGRVTLQPGGRTRAHVHERHETALYLLSGTCELWTGPSLRRESS
jgi:hypothetical protein